MPKTRNQFNGKDDSQRGSAENSSDNPSILTDLTNLTVDVNNGTCTMHGPEGLLREGNTRICGLCLGMPTERIEILRRRQQT